MDVATIYTHTHFSTMSISIFHHFTSLFLKLLLRFGNMCTETKEMCVACVPFCLTLFWKKSSVYRCGERVYTCISTIFNLNWFNLMCICLFCFPLAIGIFFSFHFFDSLTKYTSTTNSFSCWFVVWKCVRECLCVRNMFLLIDHQIFFSLSVFVPFQCSFMA